MFFAIVVTSPSLLGDGAAVTIGSYIYGNSRELSFGNYLSNSKNWSAQIGGPGATAWTNNLQEVLIRRPLWQQIGFGLAKGTSAVLALPFTLNGDASSTKRNNYTVMYRNIGIDEYGSFMRKGGNFGFGKGMFDSKQFG